MYGIWSARKRHGFRSVGVGDAKPDIAGVDLACAVGRRREAQHVGWVEHSDPIVDDPIARDGYRLRLHPSYDGA